MHSTQEAHVWCKYNYTKDVALHLCFGYIHILRMEFKGLGVLCMEGDSCQAAFQGHHTECKPAESCNT